MMESSHNRSICPDISSDAAASLGFNFRICQIISPFSISMRSIVSSVKYLKLGRSLSLILGLYCREKRSVNSLAFSLQFKTNKLFTRRGGILGDLQLFIT